MMNKINFVSDLVVNLLNEEKSRWFWVIGSLFFVGFLEVVQGKNVFLPFYGLLLVFNTILIGDIFIALRNKLLPGAKFYILLLLSFLVHLLFLFMYPKAREGLLIIDSISVGAAIILSVAVMLKIWWFNR